MMFENDLLRKLDGEGLLCELNNFVIKSFLVRFYKMVISF